MGRDAALARRPADDGRTGGGLAADVRACRVWDTTFGDTGWHPVESHLIRNGTGGRSGSVILMHCNRPISADVLERVIESYRQRGFTFVTIPQLFGLPGPVPVYPDVPAIIAWQAGAIQRACWSLID